MSVCERYIVRGRVQGVGFRAAAASEARRLGLSGWVSNRPDGSVEVLALGGETAIATLAAWLRRGPVAARVEEVQRFSETVSDTPFPFSIR